MPNKTSKLGLNTWLEDEAVDFEQINANFEKIDSFPICIESGTKTASYTGGSDSVANWRYRKYSDGTIDMWAKLNFTNLKCNGGSSAPYYSGTVQVYFPFALSSVDDVQMHLASNTRGWVSNTTGQSVLDYVKFIILGMWSESDYIYKQVFINVKGVLS